MSLDDIAKKLTQSDSSLTFYKLEEGFSDLNNLVSNTRKGGFFGSSEDMLDIYDDLMKYDSKDLSYGAQFEFDDLIKNVRNMMADYSDANDLRLNYNAKPSDFFQDIVDTLDFSNEKFWLINDRLDYVENQLQNLTDMTGEDIEGISYVLEKLDDKRFGKYSDRVSALKDKINEQVETTFEGFDGLKEYVLSDKRMTRKPDFTLYKDCEDVAKSLSLLSVNDDNEMSEYRKMVQDYIQASSFELEGLDFENEIFDNTLLKHVEAEQHFFRNNYFNFALSEERKENELTKAVDGVVEGFYSVGDFSLMKNREKAFKKMKDGLYNVLSEGVKNSDLKFHNATIKEVGATSIVTYEIMKHAMSKLSDFYRRNSEMNETSLKRFGDIIANGIKMYAEDDNLKNASVSGLMKSARANYFTSHCIKDVTQQEVNPTMYEKIVEGGKSLMNKFKNKVVAYNPLS